METANSRIRALKILALLPLVHNESGKLIKQER